MSPMSDPTPPAGRDDLRDRIAEAIDNTDVVATYEEDATVIVSAVWDVVRPALAEKDAELNRLHVAYNGAEDECTGLLAERRTWRERAEQAEAELERLTSAEAETDDAVAQRVHAALEPPETPAQEET